MLRGRGRIARGAAGVIVAIALVGSLNGSPVVAQESPPVGPASIVADEPVLVREQPGFDAVAVQTLGAGEPVEVVGPATFAEDGSAWVPVVAGGAAGYLPVGVVAALPQSSADGPAQSAGTVGGRDTTIPASPEISPAPPPDAGPETAPDPGFAVSSGSLATTSSDVNLRSGPSADADVLRVLLPGTIVVVDGEAVNGFVPVTADGTSGWAAAEYLSGDTNPTAAVATEAGPDDSPAETLAPASTEPLPEPPAGEAVTGSVIGWPFSGGTWQVIQGYNNGTHTNRSAFAQYKYSLDWARVDGGTAGLPVSAPVSGTIEWVDRGSGGVMVNMGNGFGVALFHNHPRLQRCSR